LKHFYIYTNEIFDSDLLICVGLNTEQIIKKLPNISKLSKKAFKDNIEYIANGINEPHVDGFVVSLRENGLSYFFMWLRDWKYDWTHFDLLNHEIVHYRQMLFEEKGIKDEMEFEAYFQKSVFRSLRKLLGGDKKRGQEKGLGYIC